MSDSCDKMRGAISWLSDISAIGTVVTLSRVDTWQQQQHHGGSLQQPLWWGCWQQRWVWVKLLKSCDTRSSVTFDTASITNIQNRAQYPQLCDASLVRPVPILPIHLWCENWKPFVEWSKSNWECLSECYQARAIERRKAESRMCQVHSPPPNILRQQLHLGFIDDYLETLHEAINDSVHIWSGLQIRPFRRGPWTKRMSRYIRDSGL